MPPSIPPRPTLDELVQLVAEGVVDTVVLAAPDPQGRLQGKRYAARNFLDDIVGSESEGCGYLFATDVEMSTVEGYALTSWEKGYGDVALAPDLATLRALPWLPGSVACLADARYHDGSLVEVAPRTVLRRQAERLGARGWRGLAGTELEFLVFEEPFAEAWRRGYRDLTPATRYNSDYSLIASAPLEPLIGRIRSGMEGAGMAVESSKGECHPGQFEITFRYAELVEKADEHSLFKEGAKEIAAQHGMSLTFMAKFDAREGSSCHVHLSLRDGRDEPVFADLRTGGTSEVFSAFLAGQLATVRELTLLLAPNVNSYKRFVEGSFAPTTVAWGYDNRTCAFRVVGHGPSLRIECRVPGADANPYLALAALVAGGLHGVEAGLELEPPVEGNGYALADRPRIPSSLEEATRLFDESEVARAAFGDEVVDHYVHAARVELAAFGSAVTDWERVRGFERL